MHTEKQNGGSHEDSKPDLRRSVQIPDDGENYATLEIDFKSVK